MDLPPGLLAVADRVYAEMLDELWFLDGLLLDPAKFTDEFASRLEAELGPKWCARPDDPRGDGQAGE
ncbi:MAG: hypothetical protein J2P58_05705 [Acidimicrobiaceae bacterium]|nr:hypothetical protein [Acidimicrobiaceae bacterium]